jgi:hypothetical protein
MRTWVKHEWNSTSVHGDLTKNHPFACFAHFWFVAIGLMATCATGTSADDWTYEKMVTRDRDGQPIYHAKPINPRFLNPVDEKYERDFQARARRILEAQSKQKVSAGNTYFENEKRTYGYLMAQLLAGRQDAIKDLQLEDAQAKEWHRDTQGIDFFAAFTLKHQTRKYFYFGDLLDPAYRRRMTEGAKAWTARDPFRRPHYAFTKPGEGWGPNVKNSWVDVRSTENLYLMRVTSIYLFAEATGNREVAEQYRGEIRRYTATLYRVGMGEWDSENYHGHSMAPLCNLYDFAQNDEVRSLAKACLDWIFAAGAVKYYRGAFNGPTKRDYNHAQPFGGSAANQLWVAFGDCPIDNSHWESDEVHLITSAYRPPTAVVNLARKDFSKPVELFSSKPRYEATTSGDSKSPAEFLETQYFGDSFQMGSLASGTSEDGGDVNGFKIVTASPKHGAVALQGVPGPDPLFVGSPQYQRGKTAGPNRVAQYGPLAIWLVKSGRAPWRWLVPREAKVTREKNVTFLQFHQTWIALRPLGATTLTIDDEATRLVSEGDKPKLPEHVVLASQGDSTHFCGFAIEVGEPRTHKNFDQFRTAALAAEVDLDELDTGVARYKSTDGRWLGIHWNDDPRDLGVWRNGKRHDWQWHANQLYAVQPLESKAGAPVAAPIASERGSGLLRVSAGGASFKCQVAEDGKVDWQPRN